MRDYCWDIMRINKISPSNKFMITHNIKTRKNTSLLISKKMQNKEEGGICASRAKRGITPFFFISSMFDKKNNILETLKDWKEKWFKIFLTSKLKQPLIHLLIGKTFYLLIYCLLILNFRVGYKLSDIRLHRQKS